MNTGSAYVAGTELFTASRDSLLTATMQLPLTGWNISERVYKGNPRTRKCGGKSRSTSCAFIPVLLAAAMSSAMDHAAAGCSVVADDGAVGADQVAAADAAQNRGVFATEAATQSHVHVSLLGW